MNYHIFPFWLKTHWGQIVDLLAAAPPWFTHFNAFLLEGDQYYWSTGVGICQFLVTVVSPEYSLFAQQRTGLQPFVATFRDYRAQSILKKILVVVSLQDTLTLTNSWSVWDCGLEPMEHHIFCHHCDRSVQLSFRAKWGH